MNDLRKKICGATIFFCIIIHMILGFIIHKILGSNDGYLYGLLLYILVPVMPFLVGLKRIHISFELAITIIYLTVCIAVQAATDGSLKLWHPLWVLFLLIPVYHIFRSNKKISKKTVTIDESQN